MNKKERVHSVLDGKAADQIPVAVPYVWLYYLDHFEELTGLPQMQSFAWKIMEPDKYIGIQKQILSQVDFDIFEPQPAPTREDRKNIEVLSSGGIWYRIDKRTGEKVLLNPVSGHAFDDVVNQTQFIFDKADAREKIKIIREGDYVAQGINDYLDVSMAALGRDYFVLSGGVLGTFYSCVEYVGLTNLFYLAAANPDLVDYMCQINLERSLERIRALSKAGGDAIYIDDATTTCDMISPRDYERFSLPYITEMVAEIHRQAHKAIVIYFGGIADRAELIASTGADALIMETSMKGYTNDIGEIAARIGQDIALFGNVDPVGVLQNGSDEQLNMEVERQISAGKFSCGFILSTGSPITPGTPLNKVRRFIELGQNWSED